MINFSPNERVRMKKVLLINIAFLTIVSVKAQTLTGSRLELTSHSPKIVFNAESAGQTIDNNGANHGWPGLLFNAYDQQGGPLVTKWNMTYSARDNHLYFFDYSHNRSAFELKDNGDIVFRPYSNFGIGTTTPSASFELVGNIGSSNGRNFKVTYVGGGNLANTEFSALTHITHIPNINGWTALYAKQGSAKKAGVFDGDVSVNGHIHTKEVKVDLNGWSDFVFENNYELRTLEEVEKHIAENGYLPEIPSEAEVTENGINLGEMNAKLLQKIEELTLYLIEQNKELKNAQAEILELKEKVNGLENK